MVRTHVPLVVSILFVLAARVFAAGGVQNPNENFHSVYDVGKHMYDVNLMGHTTFLAEHYLNIPQGHLHPAWRYRSYQGQAVMTHVRNPKSRFFLLYRSDHGSSYVSPWLYRAPGEETEKKGLLFVQISENGVVTPGGHTGFDKLLGNGEDFWQFIQKKANLLQPDVVHGLDELRLIGT